ncbi:MAG: RsmB/NOP family class I SAM-dependent RNA methyltransferase [Phenylobacterium sp.]|uniref:RsmB/NOP family class I SAM-dependent RNA methyltransferase n=2 Tax=Phenylobacterium sp. TaxID=1871053 RepID=UPI0025F8AC74|nr:RsmB/NOP family class I SAM-dependent RNA methyltransferase [Phenylobacterium sp.]MCA3711626.1 RsmB/NOP family class I SAM-dependent RNA methyltransferase [Phenylobacterium sp.]MCA3723009.1 RsmB/NOP family class I SAM-dependent RNA methyltransferase [Phenylobacterium sp.]MCA3727147.1 RsmB/NOP family class I SAM-dependent RNA methyltransferase [Phenylobacterium sp.]MCA3729699.1 RsmB/NOP family class I SAM-dependent RNA methyltransferase [Phenylobacterium sp.]MCA3744991.1 RsmB/NOP family clas
MRDGGRIEAAIRVLTEIETARRPARLALKAWSDGARYAGSGDRAFVAGLVLDALRRRRSAAWRVESDSPRGAVLGVLALHWNWPPDRIAAAFAEAPHGPGVLSAAEAERLAEPRDLAGAPDAVAADLPDWLAPSFLRKFGDRVQTEAEALARRAPVDLRVNTLKSDLDRALKAAGPLGAHPVPGLPLALRIDPPAAAERTPSVESLPEFVKGWMEVQDAGSQVAAACAGDIAGAQVLDLCAGGGGKTLALAAAMGPTGQIYAYDSDARRLADTVRRGERAGIRNLQVRTPLRPDPLKDLEGRMDLVFIDAPCSGSGAWRRHPDTKWRLTPEALTRRQADQDAVLDAGVLYVRPGGRMIYVTCSVLAEENEDRVAAFLGRHPGFRVLPATGDPHWLPRLTAEGYLRLTPASSDTDGFFVAVLARADGRTQA